MSGSADVITLASLEAGVEDSLLYHSDNGTEVVAIAENSRLTGARVLDGG